MVQVSHVIKVTNNTTLDSNYDTYIVDASANTITLILPTIIADGHCFILIRCDTALIFPVIIQSASLQLINGQVSVSLPPSTQVSIVSWGGQWQTFLT